LTNPVVRGFGVFEQTFLQHFAGSSEFLELVHDLARPLILISRDDWSDAQQVLGQRLGQLGYRQLRQRLLCINRTPKLM